MWEERRWRRDFIPTWRKPTNQINNAHKLCLIPGAASFEDRGAALKVGGLPTENRRPHRIHYFYRGSQRPKLSGGPHQLVRWRSTKLSGRALLVLLVNLSITHILGLLFYWSCSYKKWVNTPAVFGHMIIFWPNELMRMTGGFMGYLRLKSTRCDLFSLENWTLMNVEVKINTAVIFQPDVSHRTAYK